MIWPPGMLLSTPSGSVRIRSLQANHMAVIRLAEHVKLTGRAMPRYFIDTNDGDSFVEDEMGYDLPDAGAARDAAQAALPDMARDKIPDGDGRTFRASVRDEAGTVLYKVTLSLVGEWGAGQKPS